MGVIVLIVGTLMLFMAFSVILVMTVLFVGVIVATLAQTIRQGIAENRATKTNSEVA